MNGSSDAAKYKSILKLDGDVEKEKHIETVKKNIKAYLSKQGSTVANNDGFCDMVARMLALKREWRATLVEILEHPYFIESNVKLFKPLQNKLNIPIRSKVSFAGFSAGTNDILCNVINHCVDTRLSLDTCVYSLFYIHDVITYLSKITHDLNIDIVLESIIMISTALNETGLCEIDPTDRLLLKTMYIVIGILIKSNGLLFKVNTVDNVYEFMDYFGIDNSSADANEVDRIRHVVKKLYKREERKLNNGTANHMFYKHTSVLYNGYFGNQLP